MSMRYLLATAAAVVLVALVLIISPGLLIMPEELESGHEHSAEERWACPMLCVVVESPGLCPVCGMELERIEAGSDAVTVSATERELIGLTLVPVRPLRLRTRTRVPGTVTGAETSRAMVTAWTSGRIDRLSAPATGERVERGQTVARIYSPELIEAQQELLYALETSPADSSLLRGAGRRLRQLGASEWIVDHITETRRPLETVPVVSGYSGTVMERMVEDGDWVSSGQPLLRITDLSDIWVEAELLEGQEELLRVGDSVIVRDTRRGRPVPAAVTHMDPYFDSETGTLTARIVAEAAGTGMMAGQLVQVYSQGETGGTPEPELAVPASSVLRLGRRHIIYALAPDSAGAPPVTRMPPAALGVNLEPRLVEVGPLSYDAAGHRYLPILSGLQEGEIVAVEGAFLLDSQAELTGLPSLLSRPTEAEAE